MRTESRAFSLRYCSVRPAVRALPRKLTPHTHPSSPAEQFASYVSVRGTAPRASAAGALLLERLKVGGFIESLLLLGAIVTHGSTK